MREGVSKCVCILRHDEPNCTHLCLFEHLVAQLALLLSLHRVLHGTARRVSASD